MSFTFSDNVVKVLFIFVDIFYLETCLKGSTAFSNFNCQSFASKFFRESWYFYKNFSVSLWIVSVSMDPAGSNVAMTTRLVGVEEVSSLPISINELLVLLSLEFIRATQRSRLRAINKIVYVVSYKLGWYWGRVKTRPL